jgi:gamma-glutamyl phosphate reductase
MKTETSAMNDRSVNRPADAAVESLARETDMPVEVVQAIYTSEREKLERTARITTYVPVLIHRNVKALLRERRASL